MQKEFGILCHVTSLVSDYGIGDFGRSSKDFIDFLANNNVQIWQILPLNETNEHNCPYASTCYFSFDEMFVDPEYLISQYNLFSEEVKRLKKLSKSKKIKYEIIKKEKKRLFELAYAKIDENEFDKLFEYASAKPDVLSYAYYKVLLEENNTDNWRVINPKYWNRKSEESIKFCEENKRKIYRYVFSQYILSSQWKEIRAYAKLKGVKILGDLPIYPAPNSFDVFNNPEVYLLDKETYNPLVFGGVPKDDFSEDGQNWQTCVYDWEYLAKKKYKYLIDKVKLILENYDILRLDHFLGYTEHYEINAKNTSKGKWIKAGGSELFDILSQKVDMSRIVVEDLGVNKAEANRVKKKYNLRGMSVLLLGLGNPPYMNYLPKKVSENSLYYLVTHDNNTFLGFLKSLKTREKHRICELLEIEKNSNLDIQIDCIKQMMASGSSAVIIQMQDLLFQDKKSRMNIPGRIVECWGYKLPKNYMDIAQDTLIKIKIPLV